MPSRIAEDVVAGLAVDDALVDVHGAAGLVGQRLRHEGRIHLVAQRGFARRALEQERLVGEVERIAVDQVDLHLRGAGFVDQRVDVEVLRLAECIDVVEQRVELVDRRDAVGLAADFRAAGAADRRLQRIVRVGIRLDQVELEFRRDHRPPAARGVEIEHAAQHVARRHRHGAAVVVETVVDDLRGRLRGPGHDADRLRVADQVDVDFRRVNGAVVIRVFARDSLQEDRSRAGACPRLPRTSRPA